MLKIVEEGGTVVTLDIHHVLDDSQILENTERISEHSSILLMFIKMVYRAKYYNQCNMLMEHMKSR